MSNTLGGERALVERVAREIEAMIQTELMNGRHVPGQKLDPYNQNVLKGDYPIFGQHHFLLVGRADHAELVGVGAQPGVEHQLVLERGVQIFEDLGVALDAGEVARRAAVSPATCLRRVKRLRELGVIEQQVAILSPELLGAGLLAIVEITLERQTAEALGRKVRLVDGLAPGATPDPRWEQITLRHLHLNHRPARCARRRAPRR